MTERWAYELFMTVMYQEVSVGTIDVSTGHGAAVGSVPEGSPKTRRQAITAARALSTPARGLLNPASGPPLCFNPPRSSRPPPATCAS